jgi:peptide-methionine (S)-S-oxide reductase
MTTQKAAFAAGCFWGVEDAFDKMPGVLKTEVGYAGGHADSPTYEMVCRDATGHAETLELEYDPAQISYDTLLARFWQIHDPTTPNRQGPDIGSQYRSVIFYYTPEQKAAAEKSKIELGANNSYGRPIVTEIVPMTKFWPAEDYHQHYVKRTGHGACHVPL